MTLFEKRTGLISDYKKSTAVFSYDKILMATSTYRGGTNTYMNYLEFKLWKIRLHYAWPSKDTHHDKYTPIPDTREDELKKALVKDFNTLLVKEFTTDWQIQRLKIGLDIDVMSLDNVLILIEREKKESNNV